MGKYEVKYVDKHDDLCTIWVNADSTDEARMSAKSEYWDIKEILMVTKIK